MASCRIDLPVLAEVTRKRGRIRAAVIEMFGSLVPIKQGNLAILKRELGTLKDKIKAAERNLKGIKLDRAASKKAGKEIYKKVTPLTKAEREVESQEYKKLKAEYKAKFEDLNTQSRKKRQGRNKYFLAKDIRDLIIARMDKFAETKAWNFDPYLIPRVLKGHLSQRGFTFETLNDLSEDELRSIKVGLEKMFDKQDRGKLIGKIGGWWSMIVDEFYDPAVATLLHDGTMNALQIIKHTKIYSDDRETAIQKAIAPVKVLNAKINNTIKNLLIDADNYWGLSDEELKLFPKDPKEWSASDRAKAAELTKSGIHAFLNELADGEVKYMVTGNRTNLEIDKDFDDPAVIVSKRNRITALKKIIDRAINHQFSEFGEDSIGPGIEYITDETGERYYYAMVKNVLPDGREVNEAYLLPTTMFTKKGKTSPRPQIIFPKKSIGGNTITNPVFSDYLVEKEAKFQKMFQEGWYRASVNKNLRGYKYKTYIDKYGKKKIKRAGFDKDVKNEDYIQPSWSNYKMIGNGVFQGREDLIPPDSLFNKKSLVTKVSYVLNKDGNFDKVVEDKGSIVFDNNSHDTIWESLSRMRTITGKLFKDMKGMSQENNDKYNIGIRKLKKSLDSDTYKELTDEMSNTLGMDVNISEFQGNLLSTNDNIGEIAEDYFPRVYMDGQKLENLIRAIAGIKEKINAVDGAIGSDRKKATSYTKKTGKQSLKHINRIKLRNDNLAELQGELTILEAKIDIVLNKSSQREYNNVRANKAVRAGKHRKSFINPQKRRKDEDVLLDHIRNVYGDLYHNKLMADIMPNLAGLSDRKDLIAYTMDHVRASVGFADTRASLFGFDMSFPAWAERLNKLPFIKEKYTPEMIYHAFSKWGMINSGNLLRTGSSIVNNTQRLNYIIDHGWGIQNEASKFIEENTDNGIAEKIASEVGVLDLVTSLADMLAGGFGDERTSFKDGFIPLAQIALLQGSKSEFINSKGWFRDLFTKVVKDSRTDVKGQHLQDEVNALLTNTWLAIHGISKGEAAEVLSEKDLRRVLKSFRSYGLTQHYIDKFVSYGLAYLPGNMGMSKLKTFFTFTGVEKQMRIEAAIVGYITAQKAGLVRKFSPAEETERIAWEKDYKDKDYLEPAVVEVIRNTVYNSMFGMSTNFHPKIFRGANKLVFQFKQFPYFQMQNDWRLWQNWRRSISGLPLERQMKEVGKLLLPPMVDNKAIVDPSNTRSRLRRWLITRGLGSIIAVGLFYVPILSEITSASSRFLQKRLGRAGFGFGMLNALGRGVESPLVATPMRMIMMAMWTFMGIRGDEEEEEYDSAKKDTFRFFVPYFINIFLELSQKDDNQGKAEHMMHFVPGVSDASDVGMSIYKEYLASQRD